MVAELEIVSLMVRLWRLGASKATRWLVHIFYAARRESGIISYQNAKVRATAAICLTGIWDACV